MKTFNIILLSLLISYLMPSQANGADSSPYTKSMREALAQVDTATTVRTLQKCKYAFERLAQAYENEWLPRYYAAYCDINSVFADTKHSKAIDFLKNSSTTIEELKNDKQADASETETLEGLRVMALITLDPQVNGQKYFGEVIASLQKAIKLNPENPRPRALLLFFNAQLPPFIQQKTDTEKEIKTITSLFEKEAEGLDSPHWGKYYLHAIDPDK